MSLRIDAHIRRIEHGIGLSLLLSLVLLLGSPKTPQAQDTNEAVTEAMMAYLDQNPTDDLRRRQLAERFVQKGELDAAIEQLKTILNRSPADTATLRRLIELYDWTNRPQKTLPLYERLLRLHPNDVSARTELARRHLWANQVENSIRHLEIVVEQQPSNLTVRRDLVQQYLWTNQPEHAREVLEHIVAQKPNDLDARRQLADLYFGTGRTNDGAEQLEWIVDKNPAAVDIREQLVQQYLWTDQPEKSIHHLEQIVQAKPHDLESRKQLAQLYFQTNQTPRGIRQLKWALKQDSTDRAVRRQLADQLLAINEPTQGLAHLHALVQQHPEDRALRSTLIHRFIEHGRLNKAVRQYRWFIDHPPVDPNIESSLLQHLLWAERYEEVVSLGTQMLAATPDDVDTRLRVARALAWSDRPEEALPQVDTVLSHAPNHVAALLLSAELRRWMPRQWPKARRHAERVLTLVPNHDQATHLLRVLRRDYGGAAQAFVHHETDSNGRTHLHLPLQMTAWLGGLWHAELEITRHHFLDAATSTLNGTEGVAGIRAQFSTGTTIQLLGTATVYETGWSPFGGVVSVRQPLGPATLTTRYRRGEMRESVTALSSRHQTHEVDGHLDLRLGRHLTISGRGSHTWISDANRQLMLTGSSHIYFRASEPTLALRLSYQYEDTERIFPDSRPYWTPDQLVTLSGALSFDIPIREWFRIGSTVGLSAQEGRVGTDYGGRLQVSPGFFHSIQAAVERFGSGAYAYRAASIQYTYRF